MAEHGFGDDFRRNFVTGVAALFPIIITLLLFTWLYRYVDRTIGAATNATFCQALALDLTVFTGFFPDAPTQEVATVAGRRAYAAERFPRVVGSLAGLLAVVVAVYLLGRFLRGYIGRRLMAAVDWFFERFPVIKAVYPYARQVGELLFGRSGRRRFSQVVAIEYPRRGVYALGFMTGEAPADIERETGRALRVVFVPTSPTPLTGFVVVVAPEEIITLDMTVDEAFRYFLTAGMLASARPDTPLAPVAAPQGAEGAPASAVQALWAGRRSRAAEPNTSREKRCAARGPGNRRTAR
jgi:uncharacterized membrane protein